MRGLGLSAGSFRARALVGLCAANGSLRRFEVALLNPNPNPNS